MRRRPRQRSPWRRSAAAGCRRSRRAPDWPESARPGTAPRSASAPPRGAPRPSRRARSGATRPAGPASRTRAGGDRPAVVLCHGFMGFKDWGFFPYVADRLARAGLAVVSFNFSGAGVGDGSDTFEEPERFGHNTYTNELRDLDIVLDALTQGAFGFQLSAYGLFGHSAGGGIAVL